MNTTKKVVVIGGGFSGLSAACHLAKNGYRVRLLEKHDQLGGRARQWISGNYIFDMGPSWYWMPDIFDQFFGDFGTQTSDFYKLQLLDPGFRIFFSGGVQYDIPYQQPALEDLFERIEPGAGSALRAFLRSAKEKYRVGMSQMVSKPGLSITEFMNWEVLKGASKLHLFTPFDKYVNRYFKHPHLRQLMEFPVLFLGASPAKTPALYSLMNYAGLVLGTWYPDGGMHQIVKAMARIAENQGVEIQTNQPCQHINIQHGIATSVQTTEEEFPCDYVISSADYHHTEEQFIDPKYQNYSPNFWNKQVMAPSSLIFYLGIKGKISNLLHHNLFFDEDLYHHSEEIYDRPAWPTKPLFYVSCPSKTDSTVAPAGNENLFILMPLAAGLEDSELLRENYFQVLIQRLEKICGEEFRSRIELKRSYCITDFQIDYGAYKGNAYGLANTLNQTAIWKPKIRNKKVHNLYYTGHLTVPGPGVPPSIISGKIVAGQISSENRTK